MPATPHHFWVRKILALALEQWDETITPLRVYKFVADRKIESSYP
jgi:hypothetical protein